MKLQELMRDGWSYYRRGGGGTSIDVTAQVGQTIVVKEVDANGKPTKWESADYQERTHYAISEEVEIVPEKTITMSSNTYMGEDILPLELGRSYTVIWDGVRYDCVCSRTPEDLDGTMYAGNIIGNVALLDGGEDNTGEPFAIIVADIGAWGLFSPDIGTHTFKIVGMVDTFVQKIPEKFYTDTKPYYVTVIYDGTTATVLNNTEAEAERIRERFNSGIPIYLKMMLNDGSFMMAPLYKKGTYGANGTGNWYYYFTMMTEEGIMLVIVAEGDGETRLNATVQ